eukprot:CAMPEP_0177156146 /NCGR_PEP_ID=MMETSP0367-20130122/2566_1 /TAXON_ID=447022 ORGANISM="Scrippsiella hangoei-like, Strain SHHI-4" /NCGR_SAMPLE_ID=MMETSP0367 /ASSEMBLY_ACC=CAM_ASM_000362 /LENGTH=88 /DNA_ID=CAMNT_0018601571 /DNA_START=122 /DNA_END=388 /DNA_ORIENTATION=-
MTNQANVRTIFVQGIVRPTPMFPEHAVVIMGRELLYVLDQLRISQHQIPVGRIRRRQLCINQHFQVLLCLFEKWGVVPPQHTQSGTNS